jgi:hypothetical protein
LIRSFAPAWRPPPDETLHSDRNYRISGTQKARKNHSG